MGRVDDSFLKRQIFIESIGVLVLEDGKEGPGYGDRVRKVALRRREGLESGSRLKEEESEVDKDYCPDVSECAWDDDDYCHLAVVKEKGRCTQSSSFSDSPVWKARCQSHRLTI